MKTSPKPVNWRVDAFCAAHGIGRTKLYEAVAAGDIRLIKVGRTSLIPDTEAQAFQEKIEAGTAAIQARPSQSS